jgi:hypothetical protein
MPDSPTKGETVTETIKGVEPQPPQIALRCVDCDERIGEDEMGVFYLYDASDVQKAADEAACNIIDGAIVCDNCAFER